MKTRLPFPLLMMIRLFNLYKKSSSHTDNSLLNLLSRQIKTITTQSNFEGLVQYQEAQNLRRKDKKIKNKGPPNCFKWTETWKKSIKIVPYYDTTSPWTYKIYFCLQNVPPNLVSGYGNLVTRGVTLCQFTEITAWFFG